jgi:hypothetical protein
MSVMEVTHMVNMTQNLGLKLNAIILVSVIQVNSRNAEEHGETVSILYKQKIK